MTTHWEAWDTSQMRTETLPESTQLSTSTALEWVMALEVVIPITLLLTFLTLKTKRKALPFLMALKTTI